MIPSRSLRAAVSRTPLFAAVLLLACGAGDPTGPGSEARPFEGVLLPRAAGVRAFRNVHVVDPASATVRRDQTVLVRGSRVEAVGPVSAVSIPEGADVVDGAGAWIMPGLLDMHVHMRSADTEAYVRSGITRVRNLWGYSTLGALAAAIDAGERIGPTIHSLSSGLDGPPVHWPETQLITDPAAAESVVGRMADLGYTELKVYQDLSRPVYDAIVAAARARGMTHAGHKPSAVPLEHVLASGQRSIEHLGGYGPLTGGALDAAVRATVAAGTWNCPTLAIQAGLAGASQGTTWRREATGALYRAGARLLVGTDSGIDATQPGVSLVEEMEHFVQAGIPRAVVVRMATVDAAAYLGLSNELGAIAPGRRADLVLLSGNPLEDLNALRRPLGVGLGDRWIDMR